MSGSVNIMRFRPLNGPVLGVSHKLRMRNGYDIPQLGFGTYRQTPEEAEASVAYAVECGFRHIDCAKAYCNQNGVGRAMRHVLREKRMVKRDDMFITSKLWPTDQHPDNVEKACRETLAELQLDYLDLYLIHWPVALKHSEKFETDADKYPKDSNGKPCVDTSVTLLDTWKAMSALVEKGLVRSIGLSNCNEAHMDAVLSEPNLSVPVLNQIEFHPGLKQRHVVGANTQRSILTAAYCPLGMPTRCTPPDFTGVAKDELFSVIATHSGFSTPRIFLNWSLDMDNVVIVKSSKKENIKSNAKASMFTLSDPARWMLNTYEENIRRIRVINPTDFTPNGEPFFKDDDDDAAAKEKTGTTPPTAPPTDEAKQEKQ